MIAGYSILKWFSFFMIYAFFGWIFESTYCSINRKKITNRGFCHGPWLPLYASGACLLLLVTSGVKTNYIMVYLLGSIGGTALELITGYTMHHIFGIRYWDYSNDFLNFKGYICIKASLTWGVFAILITEYIHPFVYDICKNWNYSFELIINTAFYTLFLEDFTASFVAALNIKKKLLAAAEKSVELEKLKANIAALRERLDEGENNLEKLRNSNISPSDIRKRIEEMKARLNTIKNERTESIKNINWWTKSMLRNNPGATSALKGFNEIKEILIKKMK